MFKVLQTGWLKVIFDNEENITLLNFDMSVRNVSSPLTKRALLNFKPVSYLIPKKYFNDSKRLSYVVWH
jgi:hypothetical protein